MIPILSMWKNRGGGGRINDGGRSGGTLRYMHLLQAKRHCSRHHLNSQRAQGLSTYMS